MDTSIEGIMVEFLSRTEAIRYQMEQFDRELSD